MIKEYALYDMQDYEQYQEAQMEDYNDWLINREDSIEYKTKKPANTDTTYCTSQKCKNKCWRHKDKYKFNENENYWFMSNCEKE